MALYSLMRRPSVSVTRKTIPPGCSAKPLATVRSLDVEVKPYHHTSVPVRYLAWMVARASSGMPR